MESLGAWSRDDVRNQITRPRELGYGVGQLARRGIAAHIIVGAPRLGAAFPTGQTPSRNNRHWTSNLLKRQIPFRAPRVPAQREKRVSVCEG